MDDKLRDAHGAIRRIVEIDGQNSDPENAGYVAECILDAIGMGNVPGVTLGKVVKTGGRAQGKTMQVEKAKMRVRSPKPQDPPEEAGEAGEAGEADA